MKYIFISFSGLSYPIAYKLQQEGHEVIVGRIEDIKQYVVEEEIPTATEDEFIKHRRLHLFTGLLDFQPAEKVIEMMKKIKNPHEYFVFFEENNLYRWADKIRNLGFEGNFPTREDYLLEIVRSNAKDFVAKHYSKQLHVPEIEKFSTVKDGISFLEHTKNIWVLKPNKDG